MIVKEVMSKNIITCTKDETIIEISKRLIKYDIGMLVVIEDTISRIPVGVITDRDVINRAVIKELDPKKTKVGDILTKNVVTIGLNDHLAAAVYKMKKNKVKRLVVLDESGSLAGIVSNSDVIKQFLEVRQKLLDLSIGF